MVFKIILSKLNLQSWICRSNFADIILKTFLLNLWTYSKANTPHHWK